MQQFDKWVGRLLLTLSWLSFVGTLATAAEMSAPELLNKVRESRLNVRTVELTIAIKGKTEGKPYEWYWTISSDAEKNLTLGVMKHGGKDSVVTTSLGHGFYSPKTVARFDIYANELQKSALSIYGKDETHSLFVYVPNPRWLGMFTSTVLGGQYFHPDELWHSGAPEAAEIDSVTVEGKECWRVKWKNASHQEFMAWVNRDGSFEVLRLTSQFRGNDKLIVDTVVSSWTRPEGAGVSIPNRIVYNRTEDGVAVDEEVAVVEVSKINEPLDPEVFKIERLPGLKAGTLVNWGSAKIAPPGDPGRLIWNGSSIVQIGENELPSTAETGSPGRYRWLVGLNVLVISLLVTVMAVRRFLIAS